jgi:cellulose synthase/poly-beta-1,6-N-acetylglucosamine synthase-like glycosyltransferase
MMLLICLTTSLAVFYLSLTSLLLFGLFKLRRRKSPPKHKPVSVIVAARNEEQNIKDCINALVYQEYPRQLFEIIVVDDRSTDSTSEIANSYKERFDNIDIVRIKDTKTELPPKKYALEKGIQASNNPYLLFTDADCVPPPRWISAMVSNFDDRVGVVVGFSPYSPSKGFLASFARYENLKTAIASAGSISLGKGYMCVARNLAYRRQVYEDVGGFQDTKMSISGDDDLFLQGVTKKTDWEITFAVCSDTFVPTSAPKNIVGYVNQKKRHFSAGRYYSPIIQVYLLLFHVANFSLLASAALSIFYFSIFRIGLLFFVIKLVFDFAILARGAQVLGQRRFLVSFVPLEILYIVYNTVVGPLGILGKFNWKP